WRSGCFPLWHASSGVRPMPEQPDARADQTISDANLSEAARPTFERSAPRPDQTMSDAHLSEAAPSPQVTLDQSPGTGNSITQPPAVGGTGPTQERLGRYEIHGEIGRGGMGAVLRGRDPVLNRELALKVLLTGRQGNSDALRRFTEEAQIGGQLQHPGLVPV